ncbi:MAG: GNAT family N-acetyltransferase, partial [Pseudomonadota bacterium]
MQIQLDRTLDTHDVINLLESHLTEMRATTPPESVHALDLDGLRASSMQFWTARETNGELMGCVALKTHDASVGEIKSMRTHPDHRRKGVAAALLEHVVSAARSQ